MADFDPKKMKVLEPNKQSAQETQEQLRLRRTAELLALRRAARLIEQPPVFFIPTDFNPLALMGRLQKQDPRLGISNEWIPWSIPAAFVTASPHYTVSNRLLVYYEINWEPATEDSTRLTLTMREVLGESTDKQTDIKESTN